MFAPDGVQGGGLVDALNDGLLIRAAVEAAPDGILMVSREGRILMVNAAMEAIAGRTASELVGESLGVLIPAGRRGEHEHHLRSYFDGATRRPMGMGRDLWLERPDGRRVPVDIALGYSSAHGGATVAFVRDMSEMRRLEAQTHYQATHDTLTGLLNRWQFSQRLEQAMLQARRDGVGFALLLLDLDDFKAINDGYGHAAGDHVLREVARRLQGVLPSGDVLARLGGDEFTALLFGVSSPEDVQQQVSRLLRALCQPFQMHGFDLNFGASAGIALCPQDAADAETLLRYADMAMYHAKGRGRSNHAMYAPAMGQRMAEKIRLSERLKMALSYGGLALHYQPQLEVRSGRVVGVEALLRWNDPVLGDVSPQRFVPVAESTGLILALGAWVIDHACAQAAAWDRAGTPLRVAVNLSAQQLRQTDLVEQVQDRLRAHGTRPELLELEITESEAMVDPDHARKVLCELRGLGVGVALDDFGTGHSSLSHLRQLPVTRIKIDSHFIRPVLQSEADARMVHAVIALGRILGLEVVAEGVEDVGQLNFLAEHGCETFQGWLYSKAVPADQISQLRHGDPRLAVKAHVA